MKVLGILWLNLFCLLIISMGFITYFWSYLSSHLPESFCVFMMIVWLFTTIASFIIGLCLVIE